MKTEYTVACLFGGVGVKKIISEEARRKMSESAKKRCTPEWRKSNSAIQSTKLDINQIKNMYESGMTQVEIAELLGVSQKVVWRFMKNNSIKPRVAAKRDQTGANNHNWNGGISVNEKGYIKVRCPDHPREQNGYVFEHILVAERTIGRYLKFYENCHPNNEIVHHNNEIKNDNRPENLKVMTHSDHIKLHNRLRRKIGDKT